jgi:hypothetical protein
VTAVQIDRERLRVVLDTATRYLPAHERVAVAERVAREIARRQRRTRYPSPGALAHAIDPLATIETPALALIDRAVLRAVERMEAGQGARLAVAMPPQEGKSRRLTIATPLWLLVRNPDLRVGIASFESDNATTFSREVRNMIAAYGSGTALTPRPLSEDLLGIALRGDSTSVSRFSIAGHVGGLVAVGMKGGLTGKPLDVLVVDDPYKDREQADSPEHRAKVWAWWSNVAVPRLPSAALVVLVQTRWHPDDLYGAVLAQERALPERLRRWEFVSIPAQAERPRLDDDGNLAPGWLPDALDREPGEWLQSARGRDPEDWELRRAEVGETAWGSLYQQHPTPPEGAVFAEAHIVRNRRPADYAAASTLRAVALDPSAGGSDEFGIVAGYRGRDGRAYVTHDRSRAMSSAEGMRQAWLLVVDTAADEFVWEQNLAGPTMRAEAVGAWERIVRQVRFLDEVDRGGRRRPVHPPPTGYPPRPARAAPPSRDPVGGIAAAPPRGAARREPGRRTAARGGPRPDRARAAGPGDDRPAGASARRDRDRRETSPGDTGRDRRRDEQGLPRRHPAGARTRTDDVVGGAEVPRQARRVRVARDPAPRRPPSPVDDRRRGADPVGVRTPHRPADPPEELDPVTSGRRRHEPAELILTVRRLDDGRLRFGTPTCPGWAFTAHRPSADRGGDRPRLHRGSGRRLRPPARRAVRRGSRDRPGGATRGGARRRDSRGVAGTPPSRNRHRSTRCPGSAAQSIRARTRRRSGSASTTARGCPRAGTGTPRIRGRYRLSSPPSGSSRSSGRGRPHSANRSDPSSREIR